MTPRDHPPDRAVPGTPAPGELRNGPLEQVLADLGRWLAEGRLRGGTLSRYRGPQADLQRVNMRPVLIKGQPHLQCVYRHATRDVTKNYPAPDVVQALRPWLAADAFRHAVLHHDGGRTELKVTERGAVHARRVVDPPPTAAQPEAATARADRDAAATAPPSTPAATVPAAAPPHNRAKHYLLPLERPFLVELGVTTPAHTLVPSMARKWKQINKFIEVFSGALEASALAGASHLEVVDFGCGKGYLTFAMHDWLRHSAGIDASVTGVELRPDLVRLCSAAIERLHLQGLRIVQGDVRHWQPGRMDVMIALHACDTATDHAIDLGVRAGAGIILCSPCCHKQIRPQLLQPHPMRPILRHGIHLGQEAEMLTDSLRALLLESRGYDTQVFEFISLEHTNKNKMILGVRRGHAAAATRALQEVAALKAYYGVREHALETLLTQPAPAAE